MSFDKFTTAYIECMLWADPPEDMPDLQVFAPATLKLIQEDCDRFQRENASNIGPDLIAAGHDFWLTRQRHGSGFWDSDWDKDVGKRLTDASHKFKELWLYVGDDGLLYLE